MSDSTRKTTPNNRPEMPGSGNSNNGDLQPSKGGASSTEFTQESAASHREEQAKKYNYAIPRADPLDQTLEGRRLARPVPPPAQGTAPMIPSPVPPPSLIPVATPRQPPRSRPAARQNYLLAMLVMALFAGGLVISVALFVVLRVLTSNSTGGPLVGNGATATAPTAEIVGVVTATSAPTPSPTVGVEIQPWDGKQRLTILMMGLDKRPGDPGTAFRTDSMMVLSIDPKTKSIGLLSVPRDLFVSLPANTIVGNSYGLQRINSAYTIGELVKPGYGAQLAMQTVQYNLGMRINDSIVFEFTTVINAIDDIGGVDINVPYVVNDPQYPNMYDGYDPLYIPAGLVHMNGDLALKYARTRHQTSDFDRVKRQQQVIMAARDKVLSANMIPTLVTEAPTIWNQISRTTRADLSFQQLLQLALYLKDVPKENIHQGVLDANYCTPIVYQGADVLIPERAKIGPLLQQVFGANYNS